MKFMAIGFTDEGFFGVVKEGSSDFSFLKVENLKGFIDHCYY